jgi:hypothetical protein
MRWRPRGFPHLTPEPSAFVLHHGTTLRRARTIEANGPDPTFREPGSEHFPPAEGFSTVIGDGRLCATGSPEMAALFPDEGGPTILEISLPQWIMAIVYSDPIAAGLARGGEIRFDPESGLNELRAEWHNLTKRVIPF